MPLWPPPGKVKLGHTLSAGLWCSSPAIDPRAITWGTGQGKEDLVTSVSFPQISPMTKSTTCLRENWLAGQAVQNLKLFLVCARQSERENVVTVFALFFLPFFFSLSPTCRKLSRGFTNRQSWRFTVVWCPICCHQCLKLSPKKSQPLFASDMPNWLLYLVC